MTLLVNKKDGVRVGHPPIHFCDIFIYYKTSERTKETTARARRAPAMFTPWIRGQEGYMGNLVMAIPRNDRVSTEDGWKRVPLENVN